MEMETTDPAVYVLAPPRSHDLSKAKGRPEGRPFCAGIPVSYWCR